VTHKSQLVTISREETDAAAERYFQIICGLRENEADSLRMRESAYAVRAKLIEHINLRALIRDFDRKVVHEDGLYIEGRVFPCRVLAGLEKEHILAVYAFVLTVGDLPHAGQSIMEALYADFWGTAYTNAAGDALRAYLRQLHTRPACVSEPISPGFYGMDIKKISELFQIVDGNEIGVYLQDFIMEPLKSCAGFYFVMEEEAQLNFLSDHCSYCHKGSNSSCAFCCRGDRPRPPAYFIVNQNPLPL